MRFLNNQRTSLISAPRRSRKNFFSSHETTQGRKFTVWRKNIKGRREWERERRRRRNWSTFEVHSRVIASGRIRVLCLQRRSFIGREGEWRAYGMFVYQGVIFFDDFHSLVKNWFSFSFSLLQNSIKYTFEKYSLTIVLSAISITIHSLKSWDKSWEKG